MLAACWSPKGGSGTTVVAAVLALSLARSSPRGALIVDLAGDVPAVLGLPDPAGPGVADWLASPPGVGREALARLEVDAGRRLSLLPGGSGLAGAAAASRADDLVDVLEADGRAVVADCGRAERSPGRHVALGATLSLCVLRPCYLAVRRVIAANLRPTGVVLVGERGRSLQPRDIEEVLGVPVLAEVPVDQGLARAVDAGLLAGRPQRGIERSLEPVLEKVA